MKTTYRVLTWLNSLKEWRWAISENDCLVIHCPPRIEGHPTEAEARAQGEAVVAALVQTGRDGGSLDCECVNWAGEVKVNEPDHSNGHHPKYKLWPAYREAKRLLEEPLTNGGDR